MISSHHVAAEKKQRECLPKILGPNSLKETGKTAE